MRHNFTVTYDIVTHESAEQGDVAERGFVTADNSHIETELAVASLGENWREQWPPANVRMTLRDALNIVASCVEDSGSWFTEVDGRENYKTGEHETRSLHPPDNITAASYNRVRRLLAL